MCRKYKIAALLGGIVFLLLFFVSPDSYIYDLYGHVDSSIFFIYGKAWVNGLIPYTDFTEPKGPLLFLIYGLGYLLSNYNCIGVFWISCLFYFGVYLYTYKLVGIFNDDNRWRFVITVAMSLAWFNPLVHYEVKTEDFAQLFFVITLYYTCLLLYRDEWKKLHRAAFVFGVSFASLFLMKFNLAAMLSIMAPYLLCYSWKKGLICRSLVHIIMGGMAVVLPFVIYFSMYGNGIVTFISEYFGTTFALMRATGPKEPLVFRMLSFIFRPAPIIVLIVTLFGTIIYSKRLALYRSFPLVSFVWFYLVASIYGLSYYYYSTCAIFCVFFFLWVADFVLSRFYPSKFLIGAVSVGVVMVVSGANLIRPFINPGLQTLFFQDNDLRRDYYTYAYYMSQIEKPTWIAFCYPNGQDIPSGAIPGFVTIGPLPGESDETANMREKKIHDREVDFVSVDAHKKDVIEKMEAYGYYRYQTETSKTVLFSKHKLKALPKDFHVSNSDILLKRNIFRGKEIHQQ